MQNCLSLFSCFRPSENPEIIHRKALESANSGDFDKAKLLYEQSIALYILNIKKPKLHIKKPNIPLANVYSDFANLHSKMGNHDEAIKCFIESSKFFEKDGFSHLHISKINLKIASCYCEKGELTQASSFIEDALKIVDNRHFSKSHRALVDIYGNAGDLYEKMQSKYIESLTPTPPIDYEKKSLPPKQADSSLFVLQRPIDVENTLTSTCVSDLVNLDYQSRKNIQQGTENIQKGSENNYFSKHIDCLQKAVHFSCNIFLKDEKKRIDLYDIPNPDDENNFLIICRNIEKAFKEINNLRENHNLNAELGDKYKKTLMDNSLDKLKHVSESETVAKSFPKLVEKSSLIYERLPPFFKDTKSETPSSKTSPTKIETTSTNTSSRDDDNGAGVFPSSR